MKKKQLSRFLAVLLICLLFGSILVSCAQGNSGGETTAQDTSTEEPGKATGEESSTEEDTAYLYDSNGFLKDTVPENMKEQYDGRTFHIFTWSNQTNWEWDAKEESGDAIQDSIYLRSAALKARLGVTLDIQKQSGHWDDRKTFIEAVANNISSGAGAFDMIGHYTPAAGLGAMRKLYLDLNDLVYPDFSKPWWPSDIAESCSVRDHLYFTTGDITPTLIRQMSTIITNLDLLNQHHLEDVYSLVNSGNWTMDKLKELCVGTVSLSQADGTQTYGLTMSSNVNYDDFFYSGGFRYLDVEEDGTLILSKQLNSERFVDWFDTCRKLLKDNDDVALLAINGANGFTSGNVLFHAGSVAEVQNYLRKADFSFTILPDPKYDQAQEEYRSIVGYWVSMYSIPTDVKDADFAGVVMEVLASEGYRGITPVIYEDCFQHRYLATEKDARMFDLIHNSLVFDTGRVFADQIGIFAIFRKAALTDDEWSSIYAGNADTWKNNIEELMNTLG